MKKELLEIKDGSVQKEDSYILRQINFHIYQGETVSICGVHGAGKSCLAQVMAGTLALGQGTVFWEEEPIKTSLYRSRRLFEKKGIRYFYELPEEIYNFRVYDYIFAMRSTGWANILYSRKHARFMAEELLKEAQIELDSDMFIDELSRWQKFMLQILKYTAYGAKLIIMDGVANEFETEKLWPFLERMKKQYGLTLIYISGMIDSVAEASDRIYIMREGTVAYVGNRGGAAQPRLERAMFRYENADSYHAAPRERGEIVFESEVPGLQNQPIPLVIHEKEIVGILDMDGDLREKIIDYYSSDRIEKTTVKGIPVTTCRQLNQQGIYVIPEREQRQGIFPDLSVAENVLMSGYDKHKRCTVINRGLIKFLWEKEVKPELGEYDEQNISYLVKLKMILLRKLVLRPRLVILDNFTLRLDLVEREEILRFLETKVTSGVSFLLISSNIPEIYRVCDRVLTLEGKGRHRIYEREMEENRRNDS